jgi:hypothetical protein
VQCDDGLILNNEDAKAVERRRWHEVLPQHRTGWG